MPLSQPRHALCLTGRPGGPYRAHHESAGAGQGSTGSSSDSSAGSTDTCAYVNFVNEEGPERIHDIYPDETYARLARIKRRYDPENLFRLNQNVPPA